MGCPKNKKNTVQIASEYLKSFRNESVDEKRKKWIPQFN